MITLPDPFPDGIACRIRERRLADNGVDDIEDIMLPLWQLCDGLAEAIVDGRCETPGDLREKAEAFFWVDAGMSEDDEEARVRVVVEVMRRLKP